MPNVQCVISMLQGPNFYKWSGPLTDLADAKAADLFAQGLTLLGQNNIEQAIKTFDELISDAPRFTGGYVGKALACAWKGELNIASANYGKALDIDPSNQQALVGQGDLYMMKGEWGNAEMDFKRCLGVNSQNAAAHVGMADICEIKNDPDAAIGHYESAKAVEPDISGVVNKELVRILMTKIRQASNDKQFFNLKKYLDKVFVFAEQLPPTDKKDVACAALHFSISSLNDISTQSYVEKLDCAQKALSIWPDIKKEQDILTSNMMTARAMEMIIRTEMDVAEKMLDIAECFHGGNKRTKDSIAIAFNMLMVATTNINPARIEKCRAAIARLAA